jgi:branched-chain amino acid transport system substrate-binding protein
MLAGVKRTYKGRSLGEDYTKWPDQLDFSAELAKIGQPSRRHLHLLSRRARRAVRQAVVPGRPQQDRAALPGVLDRRDHPAAAGRAGARHARRQEWVNDLPNEQNKRYVADFKKKHNVLPVLLRRAELRRDHADRLGAEALKGDLSSKDKVRAELKKANFKSLRGDFKYNTNQFPIQNFYIQETVKDRRAHDDGQDHRHRGDRGKDSYYEKCSMK